MRKGQYRAVLGRLKDGWMDAIVLLSFVFFVRVIYIKTNRAWWKSFKYRVSVTSLYHSLFVNGTAWSFLGVFLYVRRPQLSQNLKHGLVKIQNRLFLLSLRASLIFARTGRSTRSSRPPRTRPRRIPYSASRRRRAARQSASRQVDPACSANSANGAYSSTTMASLNLQHSWR